MNDDGRGAYRDSQGQIRLLSDFEVCGDRRAFRVRFAFTNEVELREASLRNASATARLFMRNIDASIRYAVAST
ncbi:hypothetical protein GQ600_20551 [Phytophthora cactorum]|nr:hypothetical protein GQ600_20551 [Phytophthora cactorum]